MHRLPSNYYQAALLLTFENYNGKCLYLSFENYEDELQLELERTPQVQIVWRKERLFLVEGDIKPLLWAQSHWLHPKNMTIASIGEAQKILRQAFSKWASYSIYAHRRCELISKNLNTVKSPIINFNIPYIEKDYGAWTLENNNSLWYSAEVIPKLPLGIVQFQEDKVNPPSRAYLKLWELFTIHGFAPKPGARVIDMGSCPGGWTWVLQKLGCQVISVDKAPLHEKLNQLPNIEIFKKDAFSLKPEEIGPIDCFFSDIICYPEKLLDLVQKWRSSGLCNQFICTIKFKGTTDYAILEKFANIPNSKLIHLFVNKHEVTWINGF